MSDANVEVVRKDADGASFHRALVLDFDESHGVLVQLAGDKEQIWLPRHAMRQERTDEPPDGFDPQAGDLVEVQVRGRPPPCSGRAPWR